MTLAGSWVAALALLLQGPVPPGYGDTRLQTIDYRAEQVVRIETAPGYQVTVMLSPDERIESIAIGDGGGWQVTASKGGNILFVKLTQPGLATNMTVITDVRIYAFDLVPLDHASTAMPYTLEFSYPRPIENGGEPLAIVAEYRMSGSKSLWPDAIGDDGAKTYIEWPRNADLPAVYALDQGGHEVLADGMIRDDRYVIDSVASRLVFRIDKRVARAQRRPIAPSAP